MQMSINQDHAGILLMSAKTLTMFMGAESDGLYEMARIFRGLGFNCGEPYPELRACPERSRYLDPDFLWYWNAIRRFFCDVGLPPIAEVPEELTGPTEKEYHATLFARTLMQSLRKGSFICADHITALVLPLLLQSLAMLQKNGISWRLYFFYANPARGISHLLLKKGIPSRLGEFVWRNTAAAAMRHASRQIRFIGADRLDLAAMNALIREIAEFYGGETDFPEIEPPFAYAQPETPMTLFPSTKRLYQALEKGTAKERENAGRQAHLAQSEQGGWQYMDCLEYRPNGLENFVHRTGLSSTGDKCATDAGLSPPEPEPWEKGGPKTLNCPEKEARVKESRDENAAWLGLLDMAERSVLDIRNEYLARLFRHADALGRNYQGILKNLQRLDEDPAKNTGRGK